MWPLLAGPELYMSNNGSQHDSPTATMVVIPGHSIQCHTYLSLHYANMEGSNVTAGLKPYRPTGPHHDLVAGVVA